MIHHSARLLPLNALRVFHAVVRHGSFRGAADDLFVSPQAISQQIKLLEDSLGLPLFERKGRVIEPNEQGILLARYVSAAFDELTEGVRRITKVGYRSRVYVNASPYFATRYFLGRLGGFRAVMPDVDLRLTTMVELPNFAADEVDVAIQWGFGNWPPYSQTLLLQDHKVICCAPALAQRLKTPSDLAGLQLLHPVPARDLWQNILTHLGVGPHALHGNLQFQDAATMRQATLAGLGVGLLSTIDAEEDLKAGRLVAPFGMNVLQSMPANQIPGFYLILPKAHRRAKPVAAFCDWIEAEDWTKMVS